MKSQQQLLFLLFFILLVLGIIVSTLTHSAIFQHTQIDAIGHFISFFVLTWFLHVFLKLSLILLTPTLIIYGFMTEVGQAYLGFRSGQISDFVADIAGVLCFVLIRWIVLMVGFQFKK